MIIKLKTKELKKFARELEDLRAALAPEEPECNSDFYMISPDELYIHEDVGDVTYGQLSKMYYKYEHTDDISRKMGLSRRLLGSWGLPLEKTKP